MQNFIIKTACAFPSLWACFEIAQAAAPWLSPSRPGCPAAFAVADCRPQLTRSWAQQHSPRGEEQKRQTEAPVGDQDGRQELWEKTPLF